MGNVNKKITYSIDFKTDSASLETVKKSLRQLSNMGLTDIQLISKQSAQEAVNHLERIHKAAKDTQNALNASFNPKLNTTDISVFNQKIAESQGSFKNLANTMLSAGNQGRSAFANLTSQLLTTNDAMKSSNKLLDSMAKTFANTVKWSIASTVLNGITSAIRQAWSYTKQLDESLNDIRIVTGKSADEMNRFAQQANKAAKALGTSTTSYTKAALIYYQQGLGEQDVKARTETTIKAANVTGQSAAEVSEQLTAVWNGYKVVAEEAETYVDKLAAVAATTAADLEELSTGMSKVASAANAMGVNVDQLSAQLATIVSVTRQDASVVGTALKTIYARMGDLQVDGVDEFGTSLGDVSGKLQQMGINVLDQQGNLRDMGEVIEEVAEKWGTWTEAQQQAAAVAIAGKRQYNNLIALFENWDMYESALTTSQTSEGTLQEQNEIYMDSIEARLNKLKAASQGLFDSLIDSDSAKSLVDVLTWLVEAIDHLAKSMGGLGNILQMVGGLATKMFSSQIAQGLGRAYGNIKGNKFNEGQEAAVTQLTAEYEGINFTGDAKHIKEAVELKKEQLHYAKLMSAEEKEHYNNTIKATITLGEKEQELNKKRSSLQNSYAATLASPDGVHFKGAQAAAQKLTDKQLMEKYQKEAEASRSRAARLSQYTADNLPTELNGRMQARLDIDQSGLLPEYQAKLDELKQKYDITGSSLENLNGKENDFNDFTQEASKILNDNADALKQNALEMEKLEQETIDTSEAQKNLKTNVKQTKDAMKFREVTNGITQLVGTLTMAASAASMLGNAFKILKDDSLSLKEKVSQFATALLSAIGIIVPLVIQSIKMIGKEASKAEKAMGTIAIVVMIIAAAVALGAAVGKAMANTEKSALDKAKEAAEEAQQALEKANQSVQKMKEESDALTASMDKWKKGKEALAGLTEGTEEWQNKVTELNQIVSDLLLKYPQLAQYVTVGSNGVMNVSEEGWKVLQDQQNKELKEAQRNQAIAKATTTSTNMNFQRESTLRNIRANFLDERQHRSEDSAATKAAAAAGTMAAVGAVVGTVIPGIGNAVGAIVGAAVGTVVGLGGAAIDAMNEKIAVEKAQEKNDALMKEIDSALTDISKLEGEQFANAQKAIAEGNVEALIELTNVSKEAAEVMIANNDAILQNIEATKANTAALTMQKKNFLLGLAEEMGLTGEAAGVFANIAVKEIGDGDLDISDKLENEYVIAGKGVHVGDEHVGAYINTSDDREATKEAVNKWIKEGYGIEGGIVDEDMRDLTAAKFDEKEFTLSDGTKVTGREIRVAAATKAAEKEAKEKTEKYATQIKNLNNKNIGAEMAYFLNGVGNVSDWGGAITLAGIQAVEGDVDKAKAAGFDINTQAIADAKKKEEDAINKFISDNNLSTDTYSTSTFSQMTQSQRDSLGGAITRAAENGLTNSFMKVLDGYADDPEGFAKIAEKAAVVNFSDKFDFANFFFENSKGIQEKVRKQELDYFKNINKEIDKVNKGLERAVGLMKKELLDTSLLLEKKAQAQTKENLADSKDILYTYLEGVGEDDDYINEDGSINVGKINNKLATLDEEKDAKEIEHLNKILGMWDNVIKNEKAAEEAIDKVIDAQIAAYNYQYDMWNSYKDFTRKMRDFFVDVEVLAKGLAAFDEESLTSRYSKAYQNYLDSTADTSVAIDKLGDSSTLLGYLTSGQLSVGSDGKVAGNFNKTDEDLTGKSARAAWYTISNWAGDKQYLNGAIETVFGEYGAQFYNAAENTFNTAKFQAAFESDLNAVFEAATDTKESLKEMYDIWIDAQKQLSDLYSKEIEKLSSLNNILEQSTNLWKLVGKNASAVTAIYEKMSENATQNLNVAKLQMATMQEQYEKAVTSGGSEEMIETARANLQAAAEAVLDATQGQMDALAKEFSVKLQSAFDTLVGGSLEGVTEQWELAVAQDDRYLDSVNEAYAVGKLNRSIETSIDETTNVAAKNKLLAKQAEIESKLADIKERQGKLTQADLDRANAEYELTLKQIALEEAQQTANKMKLVRDANGNYSYQYVSDQDAIAKAEEELAEAENNLYNQEKDRTKSLVSEYYATMTEANQKISEAVAAGDEERVAMLKEYYEDLLGGIQEEINTSSDAFERLGGDISNWQVPFENFTSAVESMDLSTLFGDKEAGVTGSIETLIAGLFGEEGSITKLKNDIESMLAEDGILGKATSSLGSAVKDTGELAIKVGELTATANNIVSELPGLIEAVAALTAPLEGYTEEYEKWLEKNTEKAEAQTKAIEEQTEAVKKQTVATLNLADMMDKKLDGAINGISINAEGYDWGDGGWYSINANDTGTT